MKIEKAKRLVDLKYPLLGEILFKIELKETDKGPSLAWTDGTKILYTKELLDFSESEVAGILVHELLHIALEHPEIARNILRNHGEYYPEIGNIAFDAVVNRIVGEDLGFCLPKWVVKPEMIQEMLELKDKEFYEELIYWKLLKKGKGQGGDYGESKDEVAPAPTDKNKTKGKIIAEEVRKAVTETLKQKGTESGLEMDIELRRDRSSFIKKLRLAIPQTLKRSPYLHEQTKKIIAMGKDPIIKHKKRQVPDSIGVIIDTSGSISEQEFEDFLKIMWGVLGQIQRIHVYFNDTQYKDVWIKRSERKKKISIPRGGGSVFVDVLNNVEEKVVLVLSDFCIDVPPAPQKNKKYFLIYTERNGIKQFYKEYPAWENIPAWDIKEVIK